MPHSRRSCPCGPAEVRELRFATTSWSAPCLRERHDAAPHGTGTGTGTRRQSHRGAWCLPVRTHVDFRPHWQPLGARRGQVLVTPTGVSLGALRADALSVIDLEGRHVSGAKPSKEAFLHAAVYRARPDSGAVVHLHSTHAVALSCLDDVDPADVLPPLTAYYVMRVGKLPLLPYHAPGDTSLEALAETTAQHSRLLPAGQPRLSRVGNRPCRCCRCRRGARRDSQAVPDVETGDGATVDRGADVRAQEAVRSVTVTADPVLLHPLRC